MNRKKTMHVIGVVLASVLVVAGLLVVAFMILMGIAMANFGSNK